jgi:hypothetical protein
VHARPVVVVGAVFEQRDVEAAEALADELEAVEVPRIAAVEDAGITAADDPGRPQRAVSVPQRAA